MSHKQFFPIWHLQDRSIFHFPSINPPCLTLVPQFFPFAGCGKVVRRCGKKGGRVEATGSSLVAPASNRLPVARTSPLPVARTSPGRSPSREATTGRGVKRTFNSHKDTQIESLKVVACCWAIGSRASFWGRRSSSTWAIPQQRSRHLDGLTSMAVCQDIG